ncbi:MAG: YebC/PmpR family DNA-binding transcriptional regulator [Chthoniobacterales bacterium]
MGRQWLHAKKAVASLKKSQNTGKLVKEITVAARTGGGDPATNARLAAALDKARRESVSRDAIERAISKGSGAGADKTAMEHLVFEGYAPHKVPVIVEALSDNTNRTIPEMRVLFRKGQLGTQGSNKFLFEHLGIVEGFIEDVETDAEAAAIEAGANDFEKLTSEQNDDVPEAALGARFFTDATALHAASTWLKENGWTVVTAEIGYLARQFPDLEEEQRVEVGEFLQALEDHDDVSRVWAAMK